MKEITAFRTSDGQLFETSTAARTHEKTLAPSLLVGLTLQQVEDALDRKDTDLADAIETLANIITAKRMEQGDLRRRRRVINGASTPDGSTTQAGSEAPSAPSTPATDAGDIPAHLDRRPKAAA